MGKAGRFYAIIAKVDNRKLCSVSHRSAASSSSGQDDYPKRDSSRNDSHRRKSRIEAMMWGKGELREQE